METTQDVDHNDHVLVVCQSHMSETVECLELETMSWQRNERSSFAMVVIGSISDSISVFHCSFSHDLNPFLVILHGFYQQ